MTLEPPDYRKIIGAGKGGDGDQPHEDPDNLDSKQYAQIIDLWSEGEVEGLVGGAKGILLNKTPLMSKDGTLNFSDVQWAQRYGTANQPVIPFIPSAQSVKTTSLGAITTGSPGVVSITDSDVHQVKVVIDIPALQRITNKGDIYGTHVDIDIEVQYAGGSYQSVLGGSYRIQGRTYDLYQRQFAVNLSSTGSFPVNIRVRRITADSTDAKLQNTFYWSQYTEVTFGDFNYPHSALVGIRVDSEQFSSMPARQFHVRGIKVKIPHNATVDSTTGRLIYSGTFNGTLGAAQWCSDPAFILLDLLLASRYGLGDHISLSDLDVFSFYEASKYCNELVDDGTGTGNKEARFSCNCTINSRDEAYRVVNQLCSVFRCMPYYSAGSLVISQDAPRDPAYQFTLANVSDEGFIYSNTSQRVRPTVAVIKYLDLDLRDINYEEVVDVANKSRYGAVVKNVDAFATTSRGQAHRLGKWLLYVENVEREVVSFTTSIDAGVTVRPGQVIQIADPVKAGTRMAGRIKTAASTTSITPDDMTGITLGATSKLSVVMPDNSMETRTVTSISGNVFTLGSALSAVPNDNSTWIYEVITLQPSLWRVLTVEEQERCNYSVTAIQHHNEKYDHVEEGITLVPRDISDLNPVPPSPKNLTAVEVFYQTNNIAKAKISVSWTSTTNISVVRWRYENNNWESVTVRSTKTYDILNTVPGNYIIEVYAVTGSARRSLPARIDPFVATGKLGLPQPCGNVRLLPINQSSAILSWDRSTEEDVLIGGSVIIRHAKETSNAVWSKGQQIVPAAPGSETSKIVPLLPGTYLVKFQDNLGHLTADPDPYSDDAGWASMSISTTEIDPLNRLRISTVDEHTGNFQGSKTSTVYNASTDALELAISSNEAASSGEYAFNTAVTLANVYDVNIEKDLKTSTYYLNNLIDTRTALIDTWGDIDSTGTSGSKGDCLLYVRSTTDDPASSPTWTNWQEFNNIVVRGRGFQFKAKLTSDDPDQNISVLELGAFLNLQQRTESIATAISTGTSALTVTFTNAFYQAPTIAITQTSTNQVSGDYFVIGNVTRSNFQVTFKNGTNAVARSFLWSATGFGKEPT